MPHLTHRYALFAGALALTLGFASVPAWAVQPGQWVHDSEADFTAGQTEDAVVTNLGDIKLAAQSSVIGEMPEETTIIYDLQTTSDGSLYIAAGPQATLLIRKGEKIEQLLQLEKEQIFCLDITADGQLMVGVSGEKSRLAVLQKDNTLKTLVDLPDTRYIWDIKLKGNKVFLATGTEGKLLQVDLSKADKPVITELLDAAQANLLCLAIDKQGRLFAGSDTDGLVYRVSFNDKGEAKPFVMYDADEPEIGALWLAPDGTLYVGTADADQARPGRLAAASNGGQGRPTPEPAGKKPVLDPDKKPNPPVGEPKPGDIPEVPPKPKPIEPPNIEQAPGSPESPTKPENPDAGEGSPDNGDAAADVSGPVIIPASPAVIKDQAQHAQLAGLPTDLKHTISNRIALQANNTKAGDQKTQAKADADAAEAPAPTKAQRDELRSVIQQRLEQARQSGNMQTSPGGNRTAIRNQSVQRSSSPSSRRVGRTSNKQGNAVYQITPQGFVSEVFRETVMILNITGLPDGSLLIATGSEGRLFRVNTATAEITRLVKLEPNQITTILTGPDGDLLLGTANPATLARFSPQVTPKGTFTSVVLDASQISLFGRIKIVADLPLGTSVDVQTRSGNVSDPEKGPWSDWSDADTLEVDDSIAPLTPRSLPITSPPARFLQYRLTLNAQDSLSPEIAQVAASFVVPNLRPVIASVAVQVPGAPSGARGNSNPSEPQQINQNSAGKPNAQAGNSAPATMNVTWEATDPNNDSLTYKLEYRPASAKVWLPLEKELTENRYQWQTSRVPDGRYILRVTANDSADNTADATLTTSRASDTVLVDNTPPELLTVKTTPGNGQIILTGRAKDMLSTVTGVHYAADAKEQWHYILPDDLIYDSTDESFTVKILDLTPGQHVITLRATDARGNAVHEALIVEIK